MARVVHVVVTTNFAGVERYVCNVANETTVRGLKVAVIGGHPEKMAGALADDVRWLPGGSLAQALAALVRVGRQDICHAHLTYGEAVALGTRAFHRANVVSTRHLAARRGSTRLGRALAPWIGSHLSRQFAVSTFAAGQLESRPDAVLATGVPASPLLWPSGGRVVLVMQRLEREKDTLTALRAWELSRLADDGWTLRVVGSGTERAKLENFVRSHSLRGVTFTGWTPTVTVELAQAGVLLAPAPADALGLSVLEAMAAGVPVVASASGGHLETVGLLPDAPMFPPGDAEAAAKALRSLLSDEARGKASREVRSLVESRFTIERHVDRILAEYQKTQSPPRA